MADQTKLAKFITEQARTLGWSQNEVAERSGMSSAAMSNIVSKGVIPVPANCVRIAKALDIPPEILLRLAGYVRLPESMDDEEATLLSDFAKLDERAKRDVVAFVAVLKRALNERDRRHKSSD